MIKFALPQRSLYAASALIGALAFLAPNPAVAGFEWTPPPPAQQQVDIPPVTETVVQEPSTGPLTPELKIDMPVPVNQADVAIPPVSEKNEQPIAVAPIVVAEPVATETAKQPALPTSPMPMKEQQPVPSHEKTSEIPVAEGFGKDVPLVMALRDIVPPTYAFSFASPEIAGLKVSWRGGKLWPEVLRDTLASYGLAARVNDANVLTIFPLKPVDPPSRQTTPVIKQLSAAPTPEEPVALAEPAFSSPADVPPPAILPTPPVVDLKTVRSWEARPGTTLRQTLESWAKSANIELSWSTAYDYPINNAFYFKGPFKEAVDSLLSSYGRESPAPRGRLYPNMPDGPSVLMVN